MAKEPSSGDESQEVKRLTVDRRNTGAGFSPVARESASLRRRVSRTRERENAPLIFIDEK